MVVEDVSWELFKEWFRERYMFEEFIEHQLNKFNALRQGSRMVPEYEAHFMELLWYAPHLNTEKLKVNGFVFGLNVKIHVEIRILMPQTLHDFIQKALIAEEELISRVQSRTLERPVGQVSSGVQQHQTPAGLSLGYPGFQRGSTLLHLGDQHLNNKFLTEHHCSVNHNNNSLGLFNRIGHGYRMVGRWILL
jgi:hypothetical protein